ncbi:hypothetical protein HPB51_008679 [Rhipicephalus microplus]|uniref:nitric-oxide synthase (NADPH) n=1 Tax=Rhipicephalus microplus TaxID=6941 RepID=A0A9J6EZD4_RHIMP|nr:hypothetical protein HPB51_008679 [Rhipicephalus microplus]
MTHRHKILSDPGGRKITRLASVCETAGPGSFTTSSDLQQLPPVLCPFHQQRLRRPWTDKAAKMCCANSFHLWRWADTRRKSSDGDKSAKRPLIVRNVETGKMLVDSLHKIARNPLPCTSTICQGSLMCGPVRRNGRDPRPKEEVLQHAREFLDQFYTSIKRFHSKAHEKRWSEVERQVQARGTYDLTETELVFGAKLAWRNSARCIGRIQWSAITIFPPRTDGQHDYKVWNSQLIQFAGHKQPDGSVIGDPASVELTEICKKLGWKPEGGRFEALPLVLSANGEDPEIFEIPEDLIMRVKITHPVYKTIDEMQLEWYAVPAVSSMMLDVGGVEFTACPFNGWYMVTEIAVRDFCDAHRYNLAEVSTLSHAAPFYIG